MAGLGVSLVEHLCVNGARGVAMKHLSRAVQKTEKVFRRARPGIGEQKKREGPTVVHDSHAS